MDISEPCPLCILCEEWNKNDKLNADYLFTWWLPAALFSPQASTTGEPHLQHCYPPLRLPGIWGVRYAKSLSLWYFIDIDILSISIFFKISFKGILKNNNIHVFRKSAWPKDHIFLWLPFININIFEKYSIYWYIEHPNREWSPCLHCSLLGDQDEKKNDPLRHLSKTETTPSRMSAPPLS